MTVDNLLEGTKLNFQYIDRLPNYSVNPSRISYEVKFYEGTVLDVRDTEKDPVLFTTILKSDPSLERSRFLLTVQLNDGKIKSFYCGRVINLEYKIQKKKFSRKNT